MNHTFFESASYAFSAYSLPVAIVGVLSLGLGIATIFRERGSHVSIAFLAMQATVAAWLLSFAIVYSTTNAETARIWIRIMAFALVFIPVSVLAFSASVTDRWRQMRPVIALTAVISALLIAVANLDNELFTKEVVHYFWGSYPIAGPMTGVYALYQTTCLVAASVMIWNAQRITQSQTRKRRLRALFFGLSISYLSGIDFLPTSGVELYPIGFAFVGVFVVIGTIAIWRYRLVDVTPELAANQIIETITEALLVLDPDGVVRVANKSASEMLNVSQGDLIGARIADVTAGEMKSLAHLTDGDPMQLELDVCEDDNVRTFFVSTSPLGNAVGERLGTILIAHDISERKRAEDAMTKSESLYRTLVETSPDGVFVTDRTGAIVMVNRRAGELLKFDSPDELIGRNALDFVVSKDQERLRELLQKVSESEVTRSTEYTLVTGAGVEQPAELSLSRIRDRSGDVDGFMAVVRDITERKRAEETIRHFAYHDALTGLANRSLLLQRLSDAMTAADEDGTRLAVLYMDLDGMKTANDTFGHATGDDVLRRVAQRLRYLIREEDVLARVGGDEFVLVLPDLDSVHQATAVADRILETIKQPINLKTGDCSLSVSIGIVLYPDAGPGIESLLARADEAMYRAKALGGDGYQLAVAQDDLAHAI